MFQAGLVGHFILAPPGTAQSLLTTANKQGGDTLIAFAVLHVFSFSLFWGPTPWVYLGESFPLRVRPKVIVDRTVLSDYLIVPFPMTQCIALGSATSGCIIEM